MVLVVMSLSTHKTKWSHKNLHKYKKNAKDFLGDWGSKIRNIKGIKTIKYEIF